MNTSVEANERFPATAAVVTFCEKFSLDAVPEPVITQATDLVLDLLGVALAATEPGHLENFDELCELVGSRLDGSATIVGRGRIAGPEDAAMINGYLAHLVEWDDATLNPIGHPSITILPAVLALGEANHASGEQILEAYLVGLEVHSRLGQAQSRPWSSSDPWLPIGNIGLISAAVACARLLNLAPMQVANAIGLAAHFCGGLAVSGGTEAKPLGAGHAARCAVSSAQLARVGVTAPTDILEIENGFADTYFGRGGHDFQGALGNLGQGKMHLEEIGVAIKRYPAVYGTHWAADALLLLKKRHSLRPDDIAGIELRYPSASAFVDNPAPATPDEARFSMQYLLACCWLYDKPLPRHFLPEKLGARDIRAALGQIRAHVHSPDVEPPASWAYDVTVTTTDGRAVHAAVPRPHGHPRDPLDSDEVREKFLDAAGEVLGAERAGVVVDMVRELRQLRDIGELMAEIGASVLGGK